ncbi:TolC family protein [Agarilytica rhodophyticola]|uniref:TolC family protein n=1 Tax=Agarilytica rhodophyticola TaxID=1737490 RepID=UPI001319DF3F|nr:TolC family protein [Agarilytica rhodophyticola]
MVNRWFIILCLLLSVSSAHSQPISLENVLASTRSSFPKILEARQKLKQAEAAQLSAQGAFDTQLQQNSRVRTSGYYSGLYANQKIIKPLQNYNTKVFAEYRYADGEFPVYEDEYVTLEGGEFNFGVSFSLLRDRDIDEKRLELANTDLQRSMEKMRQQAVENDVQYDAALAYLNWLNTHQQLTVYQKLLTTAEERQSAIVKRVALGDSAEIELIDHQQNLLKRQGQVLKAQNALEIAAIKLSLYWRDNQGRPQRPELPTKNAGIPNFPMDLRDNIDMLVSDAIVRHPDINQVENKLEQVSNESRLYKNQLLPNVDLEVKVAHDLGAGSETRDGLESYIGLQFSMPLERRKAKGKLNKATAKIRELEFLRQRLIETLTGSLYQTHAKFINAIAQSDVSLQRSKIAQKLQVQEQKRFSEGASDIFLLNLREENSAEAEIEAITAELSHVLAGIELLGRAYQMDKL